MDTERMEDMEEVEDGPQEEDVFGEDPDGPFRYLGKVVAGNQEELKEWMEHEGYFPNVWWVSGHGNHHPIYLA